MTGGRPSSDIDLFKNKIVRLYIEGVSQSKILRTLQQEDNIKISRATLVRRLSEWNVSKYCFTKDMSRLGLSLRLRQGVRGT